MNTRHKNKQITNISENTFYNNVEGGINAKILTLSNIRLNTRIIHKYGINSKIALIMGCGDGEMINYFKNKFEKLIVIECSKNLCDIANKKFKKHKYITVIHSYFENFQPKQNWDKVDVILANHIRAC